MSTLKGKRLLLLGAGRGNLGLVKTAKQQGVYVVIAGLGGDYPCNAYADKFCFADISDPDAILKVAMEEKIDGAVICCSDTGLKAIGRCNDKLGLSGLTEREARVSSDKLLMKERLQDAGVRTAKYFRVSSKVELDEAVEKIGYPIIIKAVDLQGSRGINIVRDTSELYTAYENTMSLTRRSFCLVEEYVVGTEYGVQSFVYNGDILFVLPHGDETVMCGTAVPVGHYMPYFLNEGLYSDTVNQVKRAISALGFDNCAVNVDLIEKDGKAYIIELTGRVGANCLPELTSNYFGINYYEMILATCLGENPLPYFERRTSPCVTKAIMIRSDRNGIVKNVLIPDINNVEIHMFIHNGSEVRAFTNSNDAIGEVIVKGDSFATCNRLISDAINKIEISYE